MAEWLVVFDGTESEGVRESLCTLGNGYLATRGARPEHRADGVHYPGTYLAGCYNRLTDAVDGESVEIESLVNAPNWLPFSVRMGEGPWLGDSGVHVRDERHELDLRRGILVRRFEMRDDSGRAALVVQRRLVHQRFAHVCALQTTISVRGWSGRLTVRSTIDTEVENRGVHRYAGLASRHWNRPDKWARIGPETVLCVQTTSQSRIRLALAARTRVHGAAIAARHDVASAGQVGEEIELSVLDGQTVTIEKVVGVATSRDRAVSAPEDGAAELTEELGDFDDLLGWHALAWEQLWRRYHVELVAEGLTAGRTVRLQLFHLLQTLSTHTADADVGVPARGLHGEAYRGHVLWDELFVLPVLSLRIPEISRSLLLYRYRRLPAARLAARSAGHPGAMYPWQSGSTGREESQRFHLNPVSGRWVEDRTSRQRHVGLAVAVNTWHYWQATDDGQFLDEYGAEMILDIARYFADVAQFDSDRGRYVIRGVMGPDEFHTGYPGSPATGIDNNAYTNVVVVWVLLRAADALRALPADRRAELRELLGISAAEESRWRDITHRMFVPFHEDGLISQFEGYDRLDELDWDRYRTRYGDIRRLDRILESEGDDPNRYRVSKQADALMLLYLFSAEELRDLLTRLGYSLPTEVIPRMIDYYLARTSHGSTLSAVVHAWVLARSRRAQSVDYLMEALTSDIGDVQGGTTAEGIHLAAMAGSIDLLQRCFAGVEVRSDTLVLNPFWPAELGVLELQIRYRHHGLRLRISDAAVEVHSAVGDHRPIRISCRDEVVSLAPGATVTLGGILVRRE